MASAVQSALSQGETSITIPVTTTDDEVDFLNQVTSLREAILLANQLGAYSNNIVLGAGTYVLSLAGASEDLAMTGDLDIHGTVCIRGVDATDTIIEGSGLDRVFHISTNATAYMQDVTVRGGASQQGGGLCNLGNLILNRCSIVDNAVTAYGGGIAQQGGVLLVRNSTIAGNTAGGPGGGGVDIWRGVAELRNTTISQNNSQQGGGIYRLDGDLQILFCTIAGNKAKSDGGGIFSKASIGMLYMGNTLVSDNSAQKSADLSGPVTSQGYNFIGNTNGGSGFISTDMLGGDPMLLPLAYNGGSTRTHALRGNSPLINRGNPQSSLNDDETDQRCETYLRKRGVRVDVGAFEYFNPDEDGDGIPDEWEMANGLNPTNTADAVLDGDDDNVNNLDEYRADTRPNEGASFPGILRVDDAAGLRAITFRSSTNRLYQLQAANGLTGAWTDIGSAIAGEDGSTTVLDPGSSATRLYRVAVRQP